MSPGLLDHAIALLLLVIAPAMTRWLFPSSLAAVRASPDARRREYRWTITSQWTLVAIVLAIWFAVGRDRASLGLDLPGGLPTIAGFAITAALLTFLQLQTAAVRRGGAAARATLRAQLGTFEDFAPRTPSDARWFRGVAITAGICEELLYRGFLIAYLGSALGAWPAMVVVAAVFGLMHLHLGRSHALKGTAVGLLLGALFLGCGSLLWPMIVHTAIDLHGGTMARLALDDAP